LIMRCHMDGGGALGNRKLVMLTLTEQCNLACKYCYEIAKSRKAMSLETAKGVVESELRSTADFDEIEFDLFGGEPLLNVDVLRQLVEWTAAQSWPKRYIFFLQTNGVLVHGEVQRWLEKYRSVVCAGLSLDGMKATHDANRSNSYDKIDIDFFVRTYPEQGVRMTVFDRTVGSLSDDIAHLHALGFKKIDAFFALGMDWSDAATLEVVGRELRRLCDFYLRNPSLRECGLLDIRLPNLLRPRDAIAKWCGSGTSMVSVGVGGERYPCQAFQPNTVTSGPLLGEIDFAGVGDFADPRCEGCMLEPVCPNCYGLNFRASGDVMRRDMKTCSITKLRVLAVAYLRGCQIANGEKRMGDVEMFQTIQAIRLLHETFGVTTSHQ
jgi:uncharacterized protein